MKKQIRMLLAAMLTFSLVLGSAGQAAVFAQTGEEVSAEAEKEITGTVFCGMPDDFTLSSVDRLGKERIAEHDVVSRLDTLEPGVDYVEDEVIFYCDDPDYAQVVAEAYNGTLESCYLGVAVIKLDLNKTSVRDAVAAGADPSNNLPPVDVNAINHFTYPSEISGDDLIDNLRGEALSAKKNALDGRDWTYWTGDKGFNDPALDPSYIYPGNAGDDYEAVNGYQWMHDAVGSYRAWGVTKGEGVTVAVIDTGVCAGHEDLGTDKVDQSAYSVEPFNSSVDSVGHGTHVAGIIAARAANGKGGTGIAPESKILDVPVFNSEGHYYDETLIRGINYVSNEGNIRAQVINMSLGAPLYNDSLQKAVTAAHDAGITVCASMGNDYANNVNYPAGYEDLIAVAAMDESWQKSDFSTSGEWADVAAPGTAIFSTWNGHSKDNTTTDHNDYYASWDGTSMACPVVAAICALYISAKGGKADPDEVETELKKSVNKVSSAYKIGKGMVNAASVLESLEKTEAPELTVPAVLSGDSRITFSDEEMAGGTIGFIYTVNGKKPAAADGKITEGFFVEAINGTASVTVAELLDNGLEAGKSVKITSARITGLGTMTDTVTKDICYEGSVSAGMEVIGTEVIAKGKSVTYRLNRTLPKNTSIWTLEGAPAGVTINAKTGKVSAGKNASGSFKVVASYDGARAEKTVVVADAAKTVRVTAPAADAKVNIPVTDKNGNLKSARLYNVDVNSTDKEENVLDLKGETDNPLIPVEYESSQPSIASVDSEGRVTAKEAGTVKITCRAVDGSNKQASVTLNVIVPVSRLDMFPDKGQQCVAYGKSMKLRPAFGSAYGTPTIKKVLWAKEPVKVMGYNSKTESNDVTSKAKGYFKIANGNLAVNKNIGTLGYKYYDATVRMEATDGSGVFVEKTYHVVPPATYMSCMYRNKKIEMIAGDVGEATLFASDLGLDYSMTSGYVINPEISISNPKVASAFVLGFERLYGGIAYKIAITTLKKGSSTITIKATDGSGKKASVKVVVK